MEIGKDEIGTEKGGTLEIPKKSSSILPPKRVFRHGMGTRPPYIRSHGTVQSDQYCTFHHKRARPRVAAACESRVCCCVIHWSLCAHKRRGGAQLMGEGGWHRDVWDETRELASLGTLTVDHYQKKDEPNRPTGMRGGTLSPISRGRSFRCCSHLPPRPSKIKGEILPPPPPPDTILHIGSL